MSRGLLSIGTALGTISRIQLLLGGGPEWLPQVPNPLNLSSEW